MARSSTPIEETPREPVPVDRTAEDLMSTGKVTPMLRQYLDLKAVGLGVEPIISTACIHRIKQGVVEIGSIGGEGTAILMQVGTFEIDRIQHNGSRL